MMNPSDTIEYNSLGWVKKELDLVLEDAQKAFNIYIDDATESDKLQECIDHVHLIHGTLLMVELYGAAILAEEIEALLQALYNGDVSANDEIYQLIMGAMLRLPDYLDGLISGNKDVPIVLLPVLNDLRAARNETLLSENLLFFPDIDTQSSALEEIDIGAETTGDLQSLARRLRPHFQIGLLTWFKDEKPLSGLKRIQAVINELEKNSTERSVKRLWTVASALLESLIHKGIDSSITIKLLIGKIDRLNKELIDKGEAALAQSMPTDVIKNLLYYIARSDSLGDRVSNIKETYQLNELLPANNAEYEAALNMGGPNIDLLQTVSQAIREDFTEVKDVLEVFVHGDDQDKSKLEPLPVLLAKIADTMGMLSLGTPRQMMLDQKKQVEKFISGELSATDDEVMEVASVLLNAEAKLNNFISRKSNRADESSVDEEHDSEYQEVLSSVAREALLDFGQAKQLILLYTDSQQDVSNLQQVIKLFEAASGALFMAPLDVLAPLITGISEYIQTVLIQSRQLIPEQLDVVADAVTSIEYYLEAVIEGRKDLKADLNFGRSAVDKLRQFSAEIDHNAVADAALADAATADRPQSETATDETDEAGEKNKTAAATAAPQREELAIIGEDLDEEIFEIFIEEALEVFADINESLPVWKADNANEDARAIIRRSYHTLKGSGRLIGAMMIGEFSWSIENMLNRVIDNSIALTAEVFSVLDEAVAVLPQLIEQLQGSRQPVANLYDLMDHADALSKGEKYSPPVDAGATKAVAPGDLPADNISAEDNASELMDFSLEPEAATGDVIAQAAEDETIDFDSSGDIEFDPSEIELLDDDGATEFELTDQLATELDLPVIDETSFDLADDESSSELAFEETDLNLNSSAAAASSFDDIPAKVEIDAELFNIFRAESEGHLDTIRQILIKHKTDGSAVEPGDELIRALHTLFGSARTAEVPPIGAVSGIAEKYIKLKQQNNVSEIDQDGISALDQLVTSITETLDRLEHGKPLNNNQNLVDYFSLLYEKELELAPDSSAATTIDGNAMVSYGDIDDDLVDIFLEEAEELVEAAEKHLQNWKDEPTDTESVAELKRILHTLKGGARMAELTPIGDLTHVLETTVIAAEESETESEPLMEPMHEALDTIVNMLAKVTKREPIQSAAPAIERLTQARSGDLIQESASVSARQEEDAFAIELDDQDEAEFELSSFEVEELETEFGSPDSFEDEIEIEILSGDEQIAEPEPEHITVASDQLEETGLQADELPKSKELKPSSGSNVFRLDPHEMAKPEETVKNKAVQEQVRVRAELLNDLVNNAGEVNIYNSRFNQQLTDFGYNITEFDQTVDRLRDQLRKLEIETETQILSRHEKETSHYDADFDPLEMDRYSTFQQLSRSLMESVSDLESIKEFMNNTVRESETLLQQQSRISTDLQESLMRTRMIEFSGLSSRLARIVRQTARELNKNIEFEIVGDELEVDRSILDRIVSPLEHLLRNAVAHGIESDETRTALNKTEPGMVSIHITKEGQNLVIDVADNGSGINVDTVREKAIERGMMAAESELSDHDIVQFILEPGFSTAKEITQISGRGVGLDVVDSEIKQLGGTLDIQSKYNKGCHFVARLPMTLSINQALLVHIQEDVFAVPLNTVEGVVRLSGYELDRIYESGEGYYEFADDKYDVKYLGYLLKGRKAEHLEQAAPYPILLVKTGDLRVAVHVDSLVGRREIVVKPVGSQINSVKGISGATILGDGHVVLILDMAALLRAKTVFQIESHAEEIQREAEKAASDVLTVMVVDDSITIRKVTERILLRRGMEVILAKDGLDATAKLQERIPDIMLLDIEMPRMDGYEVATMVRNNEHMKDLPIIMITSRTGAKHKDKAMEIGVNRYLGKPYQEDELIENISAVLDEAKVS